VASIAKSSSLFAPGPAGEINDTCERPWSKIGSQFLEVNVITIESSHDRYRITVKIGGSP
jgi:hypothetical protein